MPTKAHDSWFEYSISRPYPFRWFSPVVLLGLLVFGVLFSLVNYVSTGFVLISISANDPNATVSGNQWFQHWPSLLTSKSQSTCQALSLPVNSIVSTNQTALRYTLTDVWQSSQSIADGKASLPSLLYFNNVIQNCSISSIDIDVEALDRGANQVAYAEWGVIVRSYAVCAILGANGTAMLNLTQEYDYVPPSMSMSRLSQFLGTNFIARDAEHQASLWWGESLLSTYWCGLSWQMQLIRINDSNNDQPAIRRGTLSFTPNAGHSGDISDADFFVVDYRFVTDTESPPGAFDIVSPGAYSSKADPDAGGRISTLSAQSEYPNIWTTADKLAKSAYSTILADLGQTDTHPNILTDPTALQTFTSGFATADKANAWPGPATQDYNTLKPTTGALGISASTFKAVYLCQVPQRKSAGNLFVSVFLADLVFLQFVWQGFKLLVQWLCLGKLPGAQHCEGCKVNEELVVSDGAGSRRAPFRRLRSENEETELLELRNSGR